MASKKNYSPEFKAKVAIEAIRGKKGNAELCSEFKIPSTNLHEWRDRAIDKMSQVFIPESEFNRQKRLAEEEIISLHKIIGEMAIENNFLKKKLKL